MMSMMDRGLLLRSFIACKYFLILYRFMRKSLRKLILYPSLQPILVQTEATEKKKSLASERMRIK